MWIKIGIMVLISALYSTMQADATVFNTTACFSQDQGPFSIECKKDGTETSLDIIAIRNVYFGTKLKAINCTQDDCCLPNKTSDCIYTRNDNIESIVKTCSGNTYCSSSTNRPFNGARCPNRSKYSLFPKFALLEYECINIHKLVDMCHTGITKRDTSLYLNSNIFNKNDETVNTTCSCVVTTKCNNTLEVLAVDVRLAEDEKNSDCYEDLVITDGNTAKNITCQDSGLYAFHPLFTSTSNVVHIDLTTRHKHIGKAWIQVKGTEDKSEIEVRCGDNIQLPIYNNHMCETDKPTTQPSSESTSITTLAGDKNNPESTSITTIAGDKNNLNSPDKQTGLSADIIGGVSAAVIIIILILIIILVLVFRSRRSASSASNASNGNNENIYNTTIEEELEEDHGYETLNSQSGQATGGPVGVTNPTYHSDKDKHPEQHPNNNMYDSNQNIHEIVYDNHTDLQTKS